MQEPRAVTHRLIAVVSARRAEIQHGLRIALAGLLSFAVAHALALPQGYWTVFTAVLVVQGSVGGSLKAAFDRLAGTIWGAVYGAIVATLVPHDDILLLGAALAIALTPLAFLAAFKPSYRVAPVTAVILLLGTGSAAEGPFLAALLRTIEVSLGGIIGLVVSFFVLPARAHALMGKAAGRVLERLADVFADQMAALMAPIDANALLAKNDAARVALNELEDISDEAARERRNHLTDDADPEPVTRTSRRVRHDLILIGRVAAEPLPLEIRERLRDALATLSKEGSALLRALGKAFDERNTPPRLDGFDAALASVARELEDVRDRERTVALGFALEQLQLNLHDLTRRAEEFARPSIKTQKEGAL